MRTGIHEHLDVGNAMHPVKLAGLQGQAEAALIFKTRGYLPQCEVVRRSTYGLGSSATSVPLQSEVLQDWRRREMHCRGGEGGGSVWSERPSLARWRFSAAVPSKEWMLTSAWRLGRACKLASMLP